MEVSGQIHALAPLPLGNEQLVPIRWENGWAPEPVWTWQQREKVTAPARNRNLIIQPTAQSLY